MRRHRRDIFHQRRHVGEHAPVDALEYKQARGRPGTGDEKRIVNMPVSMRAHAECFIAGQPSARRRIRSCIEGFIHSVIPAFIVFFGKL